MSPVFEREPLPRIVITSRTALHEWLSDNHDASRGMWLVSDHEAPVAYEDIVEECLIFGWIDSTIQKRPDGASELRLTPRRAGGFWSASNKQRLARLEQAGLMHAAGVAAVERAKADGSFDFLDDVEALRIPDDLAVALGSNRPDFEALTPGRRKQALYWIKSAKRSQTRQDRIDRIVQAAQRGESVF